MKKIILILLSLLIITIKGFSQQAESEVKLTKKNGKYKIEYNGKEFDANENILTVKPIGSSYTKNNLNIIRKNKLGFIDVKVPKNKNIEEFAKELKESGLFEIVEFNAFGEYTTFTPDDSLISNQWYLSNIHMYDAWGIVMGGPCIVIGILDSGTDWEHEDIGIGSDSYQNIFLNPGEDAWSDVNDPSTGNGIDDDGNGLIDDWKGWNYANNSNDSRPVFYHGTFVSGIASAKTNNGMGIAGVSGGNDSSGIRLLPYCIGLNSPDGSVVDDAIIDAVDIGVKVINLSISIASSSAINTAIQYAINNNVVIVASSGNDSSSSVSYPASNSNVIAVGATTTSNTRASFSNYGTELDIVAPGVDIYSTTPNDNYDTESGTSFAAPQVAATAALLFSIDNTLTAQEVRNIVESTAQKVGGYSYTTIAGHPNGTWNNNMGYGLLNSYAAITEALNMSISGPSPSVVCSSGSTFSVSSLPDVDSIIWSTGAYLTVYSGQNTNSPTIKSTGSGSSWVSVRLVTNCGSITLPQKNVWAGIPNNSQIDMMVMFGQSPYNILCTNTEQIIVAGHTNAQQQGIDSYYWDFGSWASYHTGYDLGGITNSRPTFYLSGYPPTSQVIKVAAHNQCGHSMTYAKSKTFYAQNCFGYRLVFSPNPATDETTMTIETTSPEESVDQAVEWEMEVYDPAQNLKDKKIKIKGDSTRLQTSGWKEGV